MLFEKTRRAPQQDPTVSGRRLALRFKVSQAQRSPVLRTRKKPEQRGSVLEPVKVWIDEMLWTDLEVPRKQRHTIERIKARLAVTDARLCAAIVDRLTFHFILIETGTESFCLQAAEAEHHGTR
ncbi:hypothetical protein [Kitasatospora sp. NPDC048538]|uniref:hypothetical protein n=1 Tax=unclassified Kitasatospora TaxID=2633591 RepID=UPI00341103FB